MLEVTVRHLKIANNCIAQSAPSTSAAVSVHGYSTAQLDAADTEANKRRRIIIINCSMTVIFCSLRTRAPCELNDTR